MKIKILFLVSVLIFILSGCMQKGCGTGKPCSSKENNVQSCKPKKSMKATEEQTCNSCGKNSCDESCTTSSSNNSINNEEILKDREDKFSTAEMKRADKLLKSGFITKIKSIKELDMGYEFRYEEPISFATELLEAINLDKKCASPYTLALVFERNSNVILYQYLASSKESKEEIGSMIEKYGLGHLLKQ